MTATGSAAAWVVAQPDSGLGTLYVRVDGGAPVALPDSAGPTSADPETPPKVIELRDGSLQLLYNVEKRVAGEKWPFASLRTRRSADRGKTWSDPVVVADDGEFGRYRNDHSFAASAAGVIYAAWLDERVNGRISLAFARSTDGGATWSSNTMVDDVSPCECCRSAMAVATDGRIHLAWRKKLPGGIRDIVVASSADEGATWSAPVRVHADDWQIDGCPDAGPSLLADGAGTLHLAWWTGKPGAAGVRYAQSADGREWAAAVPLAVGAAAAPSHVQLAQIGPDTLLAVWEDGTREDKPVVAAVSVTNGASFGAPFPVSAGGVGAAFPVVGADRGRLVILWHQDRAGGGRELVERVADR
ncbi:MAG: sialidase family protein [Gemmatimonadales bacterium]